MSYTIVTNVVTTDTSITIDKCIVLSLIVFWLKFSSAQPNLTCYHILRETALTVKILLAVKSSGHYYLIPSSLDQMSGHRYHSQKGSLLVLYCS